MKSALMFGFSTDLCKHFYQVWKNASFQAFDYGPEKNLELYGTEWPLDYMAHYHLIDIPIHFFISMNDVLIRADDILEQYNTLRSLRPDLAFVKVFEGFSHLDFTYASHHSMISEILATLRTSIKYE